MSSSSSCRPTPHQEPKQKKPKSESETEAEAAYKLIPSLPDDVALNCLARVPRFQHSTLSLVSKPIRSLLSSPLFFNARSLLHTTETLFYLTIRSFNSSQNSSLWFTLYPNLFNDQKALVPVPVPVPVPPIKDAAAYAVVGPNIYAIGGSICNRKIPSPRVWVLDCRFNRWQPGPTMRVARRNAAASVVDGKIYVMGGCEAGSTVWAEVLDPAQGKWVEVPCPFAFAYDPWSCAWGHASAVVDDNVYVNVVGGQVAFDPRNRVWEMVESMLFLGRKGTACVVDGILYCGEQSAKIHGLDVRKGAWKELKGLEGGLPGFWGVGATFAEVGGKLLVVWLCDGNGKGDEREVWCAQIELNKNQEAELWGKVCWSQKILSVPAATFIEQCSAVVL